MSDRLQLEAALAEISRLREAYAHLEAALAAADHRWLDTAAPHARGEDLQ